LKNIFGKIKNEELDEHSAIRKEIH